jgi:hypothetical protein
MLRALITRLPRVPHRFYQDAGTKRSGLLEETSGKTLAGSLILVNVEAGWALSVVVISQEPKLWRMFQHF